MVRVDLRAKLPPHLQRQIVVVDSSIECRQSFQLSAQGASQGFRVIWRVLEDSQTQYITAVEVEPDGSTRGAGEPTASALVEEIRFLRQGERKVAVVPLRVSWKASRGCSRMSASRNLELRADDRRCRKPKGPGRLLVPLK